MVPAKANLLVQETSPYLLQHRDNPVHWRAWGPAVFEEARREEKPILLSVGYAACHWCHVMAHESFSDPETAAVMNAGFVNVKVDREERPDVDAIYQAALALLGEQGGWPLTMFLTPDGTPFWGGTYFPPTPRFGRPAFRDVLRAVGASYARDPGRVASGAAALHQALERLSHRPGGGTLGADLPATAARRLLREVDPVHGGFGHAPKFPQPAHLELLWRGWKATGESALRDAVTLTLDHMSLGGIYDHLGGGFARYATDARWCVPHFEKMLYDNAQLLDLLTLVWQETRSPLYAARIEETVAWTLREMTVADGGGRGGFASSVDADSDGAEGRFYVWTEAEIDRLLGADGKDFKRAYGVTAAGNWEGVCILNRRAPALIDDALEARLAASRARLFEARETRVKPARDDKVLADWNGLMISALANAGMALGKEAWLAAAEGAFAFIQARMGVQTQMGAQTQTDGGTQTGGGAQTQTDDSARLFHSWRADTAKHRATLDDYAAMSRAAVTLFEATGKPAYLDQAEAWIATLDRDFWDREAGGYFFTAADADDLIIRTKTPADGILPSGNGMTAAVLARLHHLTGRASYLDRAEAVLDAFAGDISAGPASFAGLVNAHDLLHRALDIVVVGKPGAPDTAALLGAVHSLSLPNRVLAVIAPGIAPGTALPEGHPAHDRGQIEGRATAYVCRGETCSAPVTDPAALVQELARR